LSLDLTASTWWTEEWSYRSHTYGGRAGVSYRFPRGTRGSERRAGDVVRGGYVHEYLRYSIPEDVLADSSNFATLIALGLDPITGHGRGTKAGIFLSYERTAIDGAPEPRRGYGAVATLEYARPWLGGTFHYTEYTGDVRGYVPIGSRLVIAGRARMGQLVAERDDDVPFSERYFLGGSSSLRGWGRFQVAPLSDGIPVGGRTSFDVTMEARLAVRGPVGVVGFVDMGNVWAGNPAIDFDELRRDLGVGIRYASRVGLLRGDLGVQLNPIDGLLVDGAPESRQWRVHFSIGQSF
jgi:outer membrane translocation and assembly module TamA